MKDKAFVGFLVTMLVGCATATVRPELPLKGSKVAVLPFSFGERRLGESRAGVQMAQLLIGFLVNNVEGIEIASLKAAQNVFYGKRIEDVDWRKLAFLTEGVDYFITGHIVQLRSHIRGRDVGVYNGFAEVHTYVFDREGRQMLAKRITARYPYREISAPIPMINMSEEEFLANLMARTALLISRLFYEYKMEEE